MQQYHIKEDEWTYIQVKDNIELYSQDWLYMVNSLQPSSYNHGYALNDIIMVFADRERRPADVELLQFSEDNLDVVSNLQLNQCPVLQRFLCKTKFPMPMGNGDWGSFRPTIINIDNNSVMIVGSVISDGRTSAVDCSTRVFRGEVTDDKRDVKWAELKPMQKRRAYPIVFKIRDNVYVAGGCSPEGHEVSHCCERYDLNKKEWFKSRYFLPYSLWRASVVVNVDEKFALITGGWSEHSKHSQLGIIVFTEENGFKRLKNSSLRISRSLHKSIQIP